MKSHVDKVNLLVLVAILGLGIGTFVYARSDRSLQLAVGIVTAVAYVLWGLLHHSLKGDLYPKVVVEYVLIGVISILLLTTVVGY